MGEPNHRSGAGAKRVKVARPFNYIPEKTKLLCFWFEFNKDSGIDKIYTCLDMGSYIFTTWDVYDILVKICIPVKTRELQQRINVVHRSFEGRYDEYEEEYLAAKIHQLQNPSCKI